MRILSLYYFKTNGLKLFDDNFLYPLTAHNQNGKKIESHKKINIVFREGRRKHLRLQYRPLN
jgi:hypothetical protein